MSAMPIRTYCLSFFALVVTVALLYGLLWHGQIGSGQLHLALAIGIFTAVLTGRV